MKPQNTVGKKILFYRHSNNVKQEDLAKQIGINQSTLSLIENDKYSLTIDMLAAFAQAFAVPLAALLPDSDGHVFNNNFSDSAINHGNNIMHQHSGSEYEKKMIQDLLAAKDALIEAKEKEIRVLKEQLKKAVMKKKSTNRKL
jgi:transcriptional regulator with XRE-family HTH domain